MARVKKADQIVLSFDKASKVGTKEIEGNKGKETVTVRTCANMAEVLAVFNGNADEVLKAINAYITAKQTGPARARVNVNEDKVMTAAAENMVKQMARLGVILTVEKALEHVKAAKSGN
jgi:hypothetical protein